MASIPEPRRGPGFQVWAGPRILWPGGLSLGGQGADNGRAEALISARRPSPSCSGPGGPPARRPHPRPPLPPRDPPASGRGAAGGKAWWGGHGSDTRGRARENKGGMCAAQSPETGRRWGPGRAQGSFSEPIVRRAHSHTRCTRN